MITAITKQNVAEAINASSYFTQIAGPMTFQEQNKFFDYCQQLLSLSDEGFEFYLEKLDEDDRYDYPAGIEREDEWLDFFTKFLNDK